MAWKANLYYQKLYNIIQKKEIHTNGTETEYSVPRCRIKQKHEQNHQQKEKTKPGLKCLFKCPLGIKCLLDNMDNCHGPPSMGSNNPRGIDVRRAIAARSRARMMVRPISLGKNISGTADERRCGPGKKGGIPATSGRSRRISCGEGRHPPGTPKSNRAPDKNDICHMWVIHTRGSPRQKMKPQPPPLRCP